MQNKNFEDFMGFRDMIQGNSLDDRMEMVNYMSNKPVMARSLGGPTGMPAQQMMPAQEQVEPLAKRGDSLAELYAEAILTKNPDFFNKFYKKETKLNQVADNAKTMLNPQMGLTSMPMVQAGFGGFLKDIGLNVGKAFLGDVVGAGIGSVADSFSSGSGSAIGDFFDSSVGRGLTGAATNAAFDYASSEFFDEGEGPNIESFGFDFAAGALSDYFGRPKEERDFLGLSADEKEKELIARRLARRQSNIGTFESAKPESKDSTRKQTKPADSFLKRVGLYGGVLDKKGDVSPEGVLKRAILPAGFSLVSEAQRQSATPVDPNQGQGVGRPSKFIPDLNRRATRRQPKRDRGSITSEQARQLRTRGFFIDTKTGQRVTSQDLVGGVSYLPSTQAAKAGGLIGLAEGGQPEYPLSSRMGDIPEYGNPDSTYKVVSDSPVRVTFDNYKAWLDSIGGPQNLDFRSGRIDTVRETGHSDGPTYFNAAYGGDDGGASLYDDIPSDANRYPWAEIRDAEFNEAWFRLNDGKNIFDRPYNTTEAGDFIDPRKAVVELIKQQAALGDFGGSKETPLLDIDEDDEDFVLSLLFPDRTASQGGIIGLQEGGQPNPTYQAYQKWLAGIGGFKNLDKAGLAQGRIDMAYDEEGPIHFANPYPEGDSSAGLYTGDNYNANSWAFPEHPDFRSTFGRVKSGSNIMFDLNTGRALAPEIESGKNPLIIDSEDDPDNLEFIMSLLFPDRRASRGGLVNRAGGGDFSGMIGGNGHGMEDNVQMPIVDNGEQVATLAVSPKEYVVDAYTMAALGNGNPDEGAKIMDQTIKGIRQRAYGTRRQPNEINGTKALQSGLTSLG